MSSPERTLRERERWERRCEPHWSQEQAEMVAEMQCKRLIDLPDDDPKPANRAVAERIVVTMVCAMCGSVCDERESAQCEACDADDRRDRAGM